MRPSLRRPLILALTTALAGLALAALVVVGVGPETLLRWWQGAPVLRLEVNHRASPLEADPAARSLETAPGTDLVEVEVWTSMNDVRALAWDAPRGRILAATTGGLLAIDLARARWVEGCLELPREALQRFGTREGLPSHLLEDVAVHGDVAWLASDAGLVKFDLELGRASASPLEGLHSPRVSSLLHHEGTLWIGTHDGGLHRMVDGRLRPVSLGDRRLRTVTALAADPGARTLYVGTPQGLVRFTDGRPKRIGRAWITSVAWIEGRLVAAGPDGVFEVEGGALLRRGTQAAGAALAVGRGLVAGLEGGVHDLAGNALGLAPEAPVRAALDVGDARFWATSEGLVVTDPAGHLHPIRLGGLPDNDLSAVAVDGGRVVIGTYDRGLALLEDGAVRPFAPALPPETNHLLTAEGVAWVSTADGLWRVPLDGAPPLRLGVEAGLGSDHVSAASLGSDGTLWAATADGVTRLRPEPGSPLRWGAHTWREGHGLPSGNLYAIAAVPGGALAGTLHGLVQIESGRLTATLPTDGRLPDGWVQAVLPTPEALWVGTYDAGLVRVTDGTWERLAEGIGSAAGRINPGALAWHQGRLLVGTQGGGLLAVEGGRLRRYRVDQGLPSNDVTAFASDGEDLWVATRGGLARLRFAARTELAMEVSAP